MSESRLRAGFHLILAVQFVEPNAVELGDVVHGFIGFNDVVLIVAMPSARFSFEVNNRSRRKRTVVNRSRNVVIVPKVVEFHIVPPGDSRPIESCYCFDCFKAVVPLNRIGNLERLAIFSIELVEVIGFDSAYKHIAV